MAFCFILIAKLCKSGCRNLECDIHYHSYKLFFSRTSKFCLQIPFLQDLFPIVNRVILFF